ncbi:uncharacterized protein LOC135121164 isoform X2 [Zophobas morio]|uniref:uncharacterized protein LOC135121164 isoform X2 n=1 Tax=Zophobas morio TaxID=2755281 RepID=UPI003082D272
MNELLAVRGYKQVQLVVVQVDYFLKCFPNFVPRFGFDPYEKDLLCLKGPLPLPNKCVLEVTIWINEDFPSQHPVLHCLSPNEKDVLYNLVLDINNDRLRQKLTDIWDHVKPSLFHFLSTVSHTLVLPNPRTPTPNRSCKPKGSESLDLRENETKNLLPAIFALNSQAHKLREVDKKLSKYAKQLEKCDSQDLEKEMQLSEVFWKNQLKLLRTLENLNFEKNRREKLLENMKLEELRLKKTLEMFTNEYICLDNVVITTSPTFEEGSNF